MENQKTRRLAAIMFTDIVGYTALMQKNESVAAEKRAHHREEFEQYHKKYHGEIVQYFGDGTLSIFQSGVEAVECAIEIQKALKIGKPVPLRIGLHMGDIVFDGTDIYGDGVNLASRIESMGVAGAILLSGKLNSELKNQQQISTQSLGHFEFKNIEDPIEVFSVTNDGIKIPVHSELKGKRKDTTKSIAVLPFVNMSSNEENEYFTDGMTEEIINALAKIKNLKVTSRTSSFFFKNKKIPIPQIGQELNVATILEGSIRLSKNQMRITAQLINVSDDFHFWSETFDRSIDNIFAVQDEISLLIADKLREYIGHFEIEDRLIDTPEVPIEMYKQYLKGRYHILKMNMESTQKGISILKEVIKKQPEFPMPYLGVHGGYAFLGAIGLMNSVEAFSTGKPYLDKAIELDKDLPECQYHLAGISVWQDWDFDTTYLHLNKALEIRPAYSDAFQTMASCLATEGKIQAALSYIEKALQLDPFASMNHYMKGLIYYFNEDFDQAIASFEKCISLEPHFLLARLIQGGALILSGRTDEAMSLYQSFPPDRNGSFEKLAGMTLAYSALGNMEKAEEGITKLEAAMQTDAMGRALTILILCQTTLGRFEKAIDLIGQGIKHRLPIMIMFHPEPILKPLRSYPRFQKMIQQIMGKNHVRNFSKKKYKNSSLKKSTLEKYFLRLEKLMEEEKPYLQTECSLRQLAQMIDMHPNNLSQLLNEKIGKNFSEFINSYRIETFKAKAKDATNQHLTILGLAYESGFNSKTTFNTFFKKEMGMTPRKYLNEQHTSK